MLGEKALQEVALGAVPWLQQLHRHAFVAVTEPHLHGPEPGGVTPAEYGTAELADQRRQRAGHVPQRHGHVVEVVRQVSPHPRSSRHRSGAGAARYMRSVIARANSEVFTSEAPSISRAKS